MSTHGPGLIAGLMLVLILFLMAAAPARANSTMCLVKDGQPKAQIVIADKPTRTARFAAGELQRMLERISGARLPIVTAPLDDARLRIYVGRSSHTDALKLTDDDLQHGAFRIVSGEQWIALLGSDQDYVPAEPWIRNPTDAKEEQAVMDDWDKRSGGTWGYPAHSTHRHYSPLLDLWESDGRGSINAVYHVLRTLGMRWYYPDETGLILPSLKDVELPRINLVSRPDFPLRDLLIYYNEFFHARPGVEAMGDRIRWQLYLGLNSQLNILGHTQGHGTMLTIMRDQVKKTHPEFYAVYNGERAVRFDGYGAPCLSSPGLKEQNVRMIRAAYDLLREPSFSVSPSDSYTLCGCDLCKGKDSPQFGFKGNLSNYVWSYVDAVARDLYVTHPNHKVHGISYPPYQDAPDTVSTFSPNVIVGMCQWRSLFFDPTEREYHRKLRKDWLAKLPSKKIYIWDYYLHTWDDRSQWIYVPAFFPRLIAQDLKELKGISLGDATDVHSTNASKGDWDAMSVNHLNTYVTAACLWNADTNVDALLEEYYEKYYGPAAKPMKAFIEYAEANWMKATRDYKVIDRFFELIEPAKQAAGDGIYGKRVGRLAYYMSRLTTLRERLAKGREGAPEIRTLGLSEKEVVALDGKLDETFWSRLPEYALREVQTGRAPNWGTTFRTTWKDGSLYIGIVCKDRDTSALNITTRQPRSPSVWDGDAVEILLETQDHAYYQIAINPAGSIAEADRRMDVNTNWQSGARVATHIGEGFWSVEIRIPAAGQGAAATDPMRGVSGTMPTTTYPWYMNVCRSRPRAGGGELSAFSPTGKTDFHDTLKFGVLFTP